VVFDFQRADLQVVVNALADVAGLNLVYSELPARQVTLRTGEPVPLSAVRGLLDGVARANGLELVQEGRLIRVISHEASPPTAARQVQARNTAARQQQERRLFVLHLRHAGARATAQTLGGIFGLNVGGGGRGGDLGPDGMSLSQELDAARQVPFFERPERQAPPAAGADTTGGLSAMLHESVNVVPDELTNTLLVLATPADYETILAAVQQLDVRPLQVLIEVLIVEVRRNKNLNLGVNANIPFARGDSVSDFSLTPPSAGDVVLRLLNLGDVGASVVVRALAATGNVKILSRPVLLAQNNQRARILVGDQRPFVQLFRALPTDAAVRDQVVQYRNVGTQLTIRPTINSDQFVTLSVQQEVSNATAETQLGAPVINTREVETQLMVKDGHTAILGGLIDRQRENTNSGIPLLKDLPLLGALFRSSQNTNTSSELFLLITPHVLHTDAAMDSAVHRVRDRFEKMPGVTQDSVLFDSIAEPPPDTSVLQSDTVVIPRVVPDTASAAPLDSIGRLRDTNVPFIRRTTVARPDSTPVKRDTVSVPPDSSRVPPDSSRAPPDSSRAPPDSSTRGKPVKRTSARMPERRGAVASLPSDHNPPDQCELGRLLQPASGDSEQWHFA
jgi:general secretion pathway protein D